MAVLDTVYRKQKNFHILFYHEVINHDLLATSQIGILNCVASSGEVLLNAF